MVVWWCGGGGVVVVWWWCGGVVVRTWWCCGVNDMSLSICHHGCAPTLMSSWTECEKSPKNEAKMASSDRPDHLADPIRGHLHARNA